MLRVPGVKLFTDGGACGRPAVSWVYPDAGGGSGDLWHEQAELDALVADVQAAGFQAAIHALGDRGRAAALRAIEHALAGGPNTLRHRIEHNTLVRSDQLGRHAALGAVATLFGDFGTCAFNEGGFARDDLTPGTEGYLWRWRDLLEANPGARFAWHSDWPFLSHDPLDHLYGFATRSQRAADGTVCRPEPEQAADTIPVAAALATMTAGAAYALGQDAVLGSLEAGKLADLVVLSASPLAVDVDRIPDIAVQATLVGGIVRHCGAAAPRRLCSAP